MENILGQSKTLGNFPFNSPNKPLLEPMIHLLRVANGCLFFKLKQILVVCLATRIYSRMKDKLNLRFRIWLFSEETPFLGAGPIELLEKIMEKGSIAEAAKGMKMSYRKAWQLVKNMNKLTDAPLVTTQLGGNKGGGAIVTEKGKHLICNYHQLEREIAIFIHQKMESLEW